MKLPKIDLKKIITSPMKTRSFRVGGYSVVAAVIVLAIAIVVNLLFGALPSGVTQFDITSNQLFTISEQTESILAGLTDDITIYWLVQEGAEDITLQTLLNRYVGLSDKLTLKKIDPDVYPTFAQQYTAETLYNNSLIVERGERSRYVSYEEIYEYDYTNYYYTGTYDTSFAGESALTSAIDYVISEDLPKIYTLTGHGEATLSDTFQSAIEKENIETETLSLLTLETMPEDIDMLLICSPQSDISEKEKDMILQYLQNAGKMLLITDPLQEGKLTNLEALMEYYGVTASEGIVVEADQNYYAFGAPYYLLPEISSHTVSDPLRESGYYVLLPLAQGLNVSSDLRDTLSVTEILTTSDSAFSKAAGYNLTTYEKEDGDVGGPFALAVAITDTIDDGITSDIVWISSGAIVDDATNTQISGGNQDLFLNVVNWLCQQDESTISIHSKALGYAYLTMSEGTASTLTVLLIAIIPLAYLAVGVYVFIRRKRK